MSEKDKKEENMADIGHIDQARIKRLRERGHLMSLLEEFELLRLKFYYDKLTDKKDATRFITLLKYFAENGPTESIKLQCQLMLEKYVKKFGL